MRNIIGLIVMLAFIATPLFFVGQRPRWGSDEFVGQDTAEVGELVRFVADGEVIKWKCLPETPDCESYGTKNENFVISFRKEGVYTIIAAIYTDGSLGIYTQELKVGTPPTPTPMPPTPVINDLLAQKVAEWVTKYAVSKEICASLANNFEAVASKIESGELQTSEEIIGATAALNSTLKLDERFMAELQAYLISQADAGKLNTPSDHLAIWKSIAKGLRDAAS